MRSGNRLIDWGVPDMRTGQFVIDVVDCCASIR